MSRSELVRVRWDAPDPPSERLVRAGSRVAGMGLATLATAARLRLLRLRLGDDSPEAHGTEAASSRWEGSRSSALAATGPRPGAGRTRYLLTRLRTTFGNRGTAGERAGPGSTRDGARERALVLRDVSRRMLELHGIELGASGPLPLGPAVLAANHVSWLDPLVVASLLPCVPISKVDVSAWPVVGGIARELGVVFVTRGSARSGLRVLRASQAALGHGLPVLNFPEGTTTRGESVLPFRKGVFGIARSANVPVVPVALAYDPPDLAWVGDDAFLPHWLKLASSRRARAFVRLGAPISAARCGSALELAHAAHAEVARLLRENR
jgi:1-acyl-sn-glycerol-3-phosphate acyltransferase